jgi:ligand-binding SRPBCC domain-containing protein
VTYTFTATLDLPRPRAEVFAFFAEAENLARITPRELGFRIHTTLPIVMTAGTLIDYTLSLWGVKMKWRTRIAAWNPPNMFVDEQLSGPYKSWVHTHRFIDIPGGTRIDDQVVYALPFGPFGRIAAPIVRRQIARIFAFRELEVRRLLAE